MQLIFDPRSWDLGLNITVDEYGWCLGFLCFGLDYTRKAWR